MNRYDYDLYGPWASFCVLNKFGNLANLVASGMLHNAHQRQ